MKIGWILTGVGASLTVLVMGMGMAQRAVQTAAKSTGQTVSASSRDKRSPVLVELFTSEGCSSCPSADKLIAELAHSQPVDGAEIIALEEHVDYWNRIGWTDPFSSAKFTRRQYDYGNHFRLQTVYTPQAVVDGGKEFVGSDRESTLSSVETAAKQPKSEIHLKVTSDDTKQVKVTVESEKLSGGSGPSEVVLVLAEDDLKVHVRSGENSGRNLVHYGVVRSFQKLGMQKTGTTFAVQTSIPLDSAWKHANLRLVAFVQNQNSRKVQAVASLKLAAG